MSTDGPLDLLRRAIEHHRAGDLEGAAALYHTVLQQNPEQPDALSMLGVLLLQRGDPASAIDLIGKALALQPENAAAHANIGRAFQAVGRLEEAAAALRRATELQPEAAESWDALGSALQAMGDAAGAEQAYCTALARNPDLAASHNNLGGLYRQAGRLADAEQHLTRANTLLQGHPVVLSNLATLRLDEGRAGEAEALLRQALQRNPQDGEAHNNLGNALLALGRPEDAAASYAAAIPLLPGVPEPASNLGAALVETGHFAAALPRFEAALAIRPDYVEALSGKVWCLQHLCRWDGLDETIGALLTATEARIAAGQPPALPPFRALCLETTAAQQRRIAEAHARATLAPLAKATTLPDPPPRPADGRIRIGYLSSDIQSHATMVLIGDLFAAHDRSRFAVTVYSYGPDDGSAARRNAERDAEHFADIRDLGAADAARRIRADGIDVLVDLKGYTFGNRAQITALRPAALQAAWLGYPGTMGLDAVDYILTDRLITPPGAEDGFTEQPVRLPSSYQMNPSPAPAPGTPPSRDDAGLPEGVPVLCCFNNAYKITAPVFAVWMRVLAAAPQAVLWLLSDGAEAETALRAAAENHGIDPTRLIFAPRIGGAAHLARQACADLFLDTTPVCAHTTARDALWAGLPLLTCPGETFVSRVAAGLLAAQGLDSLIMPDMAAYEAEASRLARDPAALAALRDTVAGSRATGTLFDAPRFVRGLEAAYTEMWRRHMAGEPPAPLDVPPQS